LREFFTNRFQLALFVWLISHQPTVLFSQNKPVTSNQPAVLFSQNKPVTSNQPAVLFSQNKLAPAISHQPNEQAGNGLWPRFSLLGKYMVKVELAFLVTASQVHAR
jgi:hypothetical protein